MTQLEAWVTGMVAGALLRGKVEELGMRIEVPMDAEGNYCPFIIVHMTDATLRITVREQ